MLLLRPGDTLTALLFQLGPLGFLFGIRVVGWQESAAQQKLRVLLPAKRDPEEIEKPRSPRCYLRLPERMLAARRIRSR